MKLQEFNNFLLSEHMRDYKNGISDALLIGIMAEEYGPFYKQGYDFGLSLYCEYNEKENLLAEGLKVAYKDTIIKENDEVIILSTSNKERSQK